MMPQRKQNLLLLASAAVVSQSKITVQRALPGELMHHLLSLVALLGLFAFPLTAFAQDLALKRVMLSSGGLGYFEYEEYKVMGLAPYGEPKYRDAILSAAGVPREQVLHALRGDLELGGDLFDRRVPIQLLAEDASRLRHLADLIRDVHREADRAALLR